LRLNAVELEVDGNTEDRRIGLLEGLIYGAIVEANANDILPQIEAVKGYRVGQSRPRILIVAPKDHWRSGYPSWTEFLPLVVEIARLLPIDIRLLSYDDWAVQDLGLDGGRPKWRKDVILSSVS
jgi:hypothetical protein